MKQNEITFDTEKLVVHWLCNIVEGLLMVVFKIKIIYHL